MVFFAGTDFCDGEDLCAATRMRLGRSSSSSDESEILSSFLRDCKSRERLAQLGDFWAVSDSDSLFSDRFAGLLTNDEPCTHAS